MAGGVDAVGELGLGAGDAVGSCSLPDEVEDMLSG